MQYGLGRNGSLTVHVIGDGFAGWDAFAAPAFAFGGLEALEEVEEGEDGGGLGVDRWEVGEFHEGWMWWLVLGLNCIFVGYLRGVERREVEERSFT